MICAIHQPHYLPWGRYLQKVIQADVFIFLDDVDFTKNGWQNRNKIKAPTGAHTLTVPVRHTLGQKINETLICNDQPWVKKHLGTIELFYRKAPFFRQLFESLQEVLRRTHPTLADLNWDLLHWHLKVLGVERIVVRSSELAVTSSSSQRIADLVHKVGCDTYLTGAYALEVYLDEKTLADAGIRLLIQEWQVAEYPQLHPEAGFLGDLATLDMLMNLGPEAQRLLA